MSQLVPRELYTNSSTWNSTVWQLAAISGPAIGGLVYGFFGVRIAYLGVLVFLITAMVLLGLVKNHPAPPRVEGETLIQRLSTGLKFVYNNQILLGAMSLDMFAVLFGGAVAMLPVFAAEVLNVGPQGLGFLRAAPQQEGAATAVDVARKLVESDHVAAIFGPTDDDRGCRVWAEHHLFCPVKEFLPVVFFTDDERHV